MNRFLQLVDRLGAWAASMGKTAFDVIALFYDTVTAIFVGGKKGIAASLKQTVNQILFTGVEAFWLVGIIGLLCGITIIIQAMTTMPKFGVGEYFGNILVMVVVRELGPFFTSLVVVGRSGSALAAYIGNMRVAKELSALEMMGIDPVHFIVMPAFFAMVVSMVCLSVYFDVIAIIGGYFIAQVKVSIPFGFFMGTVLDSLRPNDIIISIFKNVLFGSIVALMSCYHGLAVTNMREVPQAALKSVVSCMIITLLINILVTFFTFFLSL
ncbi:MAG TPA: ABC transporter permease [Chitinivibrionales bacterium]|nr:ABC transporter permease [Chitinivibrionales bacterium]